LEAGLKMGVISDFGRSLTKLSLHASALNALDIEGYGGPVGESLL